MGTLDQANLESRKIASIIFRPWMGRAALRDVKTFSKFVREIDCSPGKITTYVFLKR